MFLYFFSSKTAIYLSLGLHKVGYVQVIEEAFSSQKRPSKTSKHELLQIIVYFCGSFLPSWIRIRIRNPDPDPQTRLNTDPIRIHNPDCDCIRIRIQNTADPPIHRVHIYTRGETRLVYLPTQLERTLQLYW
jgi:hypothetical protein